MSTPARPQPASQPAHPVVGRDPVELARAEAALADTEAALQKDQQELGARLLRVETFRGELRKRLEEEGAHGVTDAAPLLGKLPASVLPQHVPQQATALDARLLALEARAQAVAATKEMLAATEKQALKAWAHLQEVSAAADGLKRPEPVAPKVAAAPEVPPAPVVAPAPRPQPAAPARPSPENKRQAPRVRVNCDVDMETETNFFSGFGWDLSTGGLFVASFDEMPVGTEVDLAFTLPDGTKVEASAVVRWHREEERSNATMLPGVGLQFTKLSSESEAAIKRFLDAREPMFYTT